MQEIKLQAVTNQLQCSMDCPNYESYAGATMRFECNLIYEEKLNNQLDRTITCMRLFDPKLHD